mmetsp:Transcript_17020/g.30889  ORF Transcript_17020/g.30889 Transcript_17020/m.30889 type:complete len:275 (-) Transcript_17020:63-887(-)
MGSVFGKESVKEPPFDILLLRPNVKTPYELRKYGIRFAASVTYADTNDTGSPFGILAKYIGVFGTAQNEGSTSIAMTAPVVMEKEPEAIAMTAPVIMEDSVAGEDGTNRKKMMFMLPSEYDDMSKIPKPTNPAVHIEELPSEIGVVHRFNGSYKDPIKQEVAKEFAVQLMQDGVTGITQQYVMDNFQFWGYNPPFTLPHFRRNEIWLKLNDEQVTYLKEKFPTSNEGGGGLKGGSSSSSTMSGRTKFGLGASGLLVGAVAVGYLLRSRSQYRRL